MKRGLMNWIEHSYSDNCKPKKFVRQIHIYPMGTGAITQLNRIFREEAEKLLRLT